MSSEVSSLLKNQNLRQSGGNLGISNNNSGMGIDNQISTVHSPIYNEYNEGMPSSSGAYAHPRAGAYNNRGPQGAGRQVLNQL